MIFKEDHFTKDCLCLAKIDQYLERGPSSSTPAILTNPPPQQQQLVMQTQPPTPGGNP
jgi:hypothetical protein